VAFNPNYVPWMSILGVVGAVIGYLAGGGGSGPEATVPALYGLVAGSLAGIVVRIFLRKRTQKRYDADQSP